MCGKRQLCAMWQLTDSLGKGIMLQESATPSFNVETQGYQMVELKI